MLEMRIHHRWLAIFAAFIGVGDAVRAVEPHEAFLEKHCARCHGPEKMKGELRIDRLSRDFKTGADATRWAEVIERVNAGEMPPKSEPKPTQQEIAGFVTKLDSLIKEGRASRMGARSPVAHYRLSRKEYQNTIYDLLGVRYDPTKPGELNADSLWHGYERLGSELTLSPSHVDRYYRAADLVLDRAFPAASVDARKVRMTAAQLRYDGGKRQQEALDRFGIKRPLRYLLYPGSVQNALSPHWLGKTGPEHSGLYKLRIQASGIRPPGGQTAHLSIGKRTGEETVDGLIETDITAPEDKPQVLEFEIFLEMPVSLDFCVVATDVVDRRAGAAFRNALGSRGGYIFTHSSETTLLNPNAPQMFDDKGNGIFSTVLLDWIEWEGPIQTDAEKSRRNDILPPKDSSPEVAAEHLRRFAERAWRRPVQPEELSNYMKSYADEVKAGEKQPDAYRTALLGVLTSRNFIYHIEGETAARDRLNDWELASRLSYFLWSSMPDAGLFSAAASGKLSKPEELAGQFRRMAKDPRISRLVESFPRQWLQLHRVGQFPPDPGLYPDYDKWLERSMVLESQAYFGEMMAGNLPLAEFLNSDWTMANARIAGHYRIPPPVGKGFQKVKLESGNHRGGILTHASVLSLTSDGTRHRPVHRGVWVSEAIFGRTPPPPPPNVEPLMPTPSDKPKATIRQQLKAHSTHSVCASCHQKIDPLGFAFDNFDAIGRWRTMEESPGGTGDNPPVDASGVLLGGKPFSGPGEFKKLLVSDIDRFAEAFIGQLATYATRRVMTIDDASAIRAVAASCRKDGYRLGDIMVALVSSELFRKR